MSNDASNPTFYLLVELAKAKDELRRERRRASKARAQARRWRQEAKDWKWQAVTLMKKRAA